MSFFSVKGLCAGYGSIPVFEDISFEITEGSVIGILGANGSGKTTLLKAVCGILPHAGNCVLDGTVLEGLSPRNIAKLCSYIPQRSGITIDISVLDVVLMGFNPRLGLLEQPDGQMKSRAVETLARVGLCGREQENYRHLSEGQKQLCILARTLVMQTKLLLLDEPESALDIGHRYGMMQLLRSLAAGEDRAALVTLHDPNLALQYCDKLILLKDGGIFAEIHPRRDSLPDMERALGEIYGPVSLARCWDSRGKAHLVMLKTEEEP